MTILQAQVNSEEKPNVNDLPPATIEFAQRMFEAARTGNAELLLAAVDAGLPVNLTNDKGQTELTKELLKRGADPNRLNDLGQSIVAGAVFKAYDDIVRALVEKGADPRSGTPNAIQAAHMFGRKELMGVLGTKEGDIGLEVPTPPSAHRD
ncbi:hypothetical protein DXG01_000126 [Tephrocybe rancida]|nr:hypothetical protein DXG01_000126 [Tephrocybe rancida]